ncbi:MAG: hypothetical protein VX701_05835, partial [Chloroflexota bacterium]|nr:hypothetical protein [Chloroflexota bacterium]
HTHRANSHILVRGSVHHCVACDTDENIAEMCSDGDRRAVGRYRRHRANQTLASVEGQRKRDTSEG